MQFLPSESFPDSYFQIYVASRNSRHVFITWKTTLSKYPKIQRVYFQFFSVKGLKGGKNYFWVGSRALKTFIYLFPHGFFFNFLVNNQCYMEFADSFERCFLPANVGSYRLSPATKSICGKFTSFTSFYIFFLFFFSCLFFSFDSKCRAINQGVIFLLKGGFILRG